MNSTMIIAATAVAITAMFCLVAMRALRSWLELKRLELAERAAPAEDEGGEDIGVRIELAAMRERLRRLEDIASHVEL
jgi:hypothetical protein